MQISRVSRNKHTAKLTYDRLSPIYDGLAGSSETQFMHQGLEMLGLNTGETVLEIGCGTGKAQVELYQQVGDPGKVYAIDLSRGMLQKSRSRLVSAGFKQQVSLLEGDGSCLPYRNGCFNVVFTCFTLELFDTPEIPRVLQECWRVLEPNGRLGVVCMLKTEKPGRIERLYEWFHRVLPAYVDCRPIDAQGMIQAAGFSVLEHRVTSMWGLPVEVLIASKV
jgi:demethylmenaquinone methyltransferase/2-methoxy-6-polyprenyl-1,4-benzoquinol methylase